MRELFRFIIKKALSSHYYHSIVKLSVLVFVFLASYSVYYQGITKKNQLLDELKKKRETLLQSRGELLAFQAQLQEEIASSADINWVELSLMRRLGVVPEGQTKVHFFADDSKRDS